MAGTDAPPGHFIMECETFEVPGRYEMDRDAQGKHCDFWWTLPRHCMVSSERGLPSQFGNGIVAEELLAKKYGHSIHFCDLRAGKNIQTIDPVPADPDDLPGLLKGFSAVSPLIKGIDLSLDDKYLYVAFRGLGEMHP